VCSVLGRTGELALEFVGKAEVGVVESEALGRVGGGRWEVGFGGAGG
jgi:hypothetical protein